MELDLVDRLTPGLARAAVAAGVLDRALKDLDGSSVRSGKSLDQPAKGTTKVGDSARKAGPDIDRFSGRLRTLAGAAVTLGPALIPLGAGIIPALTAAIAGLGAAAGGIGVTVLAMHGLGDAIKSIDEYRLEPTVVNLEKLRLEMEKLGPAGADFAHYLANLEPQMRELQNVARAGLFPGLEDGIEALLTRGPQINRIISELATGMGDIARSAGEGLASDEWTPFFDYIESEAKPTLEAFAQSTGNVALGLGNMLVAFAPLSRDFTGGLVKATEAFARWSQGLDENQSFQSFVDYVRQSGPQVIDFIAAIAKAMAGLAHAAAPWGSVLLPVLTGVANVFGTLSASPIGPALYTATAMMIAFNRAASVASKGLDRFSMSSDRTATALGRFPALASGVLGVGIAVGALADNMNRIDSENLDRSLTALGFGDVTETIDKVVSSLDNLESNWNKVDLGEGATAFGLFGDSSLDKFADNVDQVDQALARLVESGDTAQAADLFQKISDLAADKGVSASDTAKRFDAYALALQNVASASKVAAGYSKIFDFRSLGDSLDDAADSAEHFSGALARLNGWFDKRDAVRGYKDAIDTLRKSLKNGFTREDSANLDGIGRSITQVAQNIKNPKLRDNFLSQARAQLVDMAEHSGPKAAAAIQEVIDKFDDKGLTHPPKLPKIVPEVDDKPARVHSDDLRTKITGDINAVNKLKAAPWIGINPNEFDRGYGTFLGQMARAGRMTAKPKITVDTGQASSAVGGLRSQIDGLHDKTIRINIVKNPLSVFGVTGVGPPAGSADGSTVPKTGRPYADRHPYLLADGEEVISNRYGQADRHRSLLKAINANRLAQGGTTGANTHTSSPVSFWNQGGGPHWMSELAGSAQGAATGLKGLKKQLDAQQKAYDKAKSTRDEAISRRDSISSSIRDGLAGDDIWAASSGSMWAAGAHGANSPAAAQAALQAQKARAQRLIAAINTLKAKGITGPVLLEIIGSGDVDRAEAMASLDVGSLSSFASVYNETQSTLAAAGLAGGNAIEGANIAASNRRLDTLHHDLQEIKQAVNQAEKANDKAQDKNAKDVKDGVNSAAFHGIRRGKR